MSAIRKTDILISVILSVLVSVFVIKVQISFRVLTCCVICRKR